MALLTVLFKDRDSRKSIKAKLKNKLLDCVEAITAAVEKCYDALGDVTLLR
jgi:hypothetical protein